MAVVWCSARAQQSDDPDPTALSARISVDVPIAADSPTRTTRDQTGDRRRLRFVRRRDPVRLAVCRSARCKGQTGRCRNFIRFCSLRSGDRDSLVAMAQVLGSSRLTTTGTVVAVAAALIGARCLTATTLVTTTAVPTASAVSDLVVGTIFLAVGVLLCCRAVT